MKKNDLLIPTERINEILNDAYLGIDVQEKDILNPLTEIPEDFADNPELYITYLLGQPDFFGFTCKYILGVETIPMQNVILKELWERKFPMLIGSRGLSKSFTIAIYCILRMLFCQNRKIIICGSAFRQSKIIFQYIETIISNSSILRKMFPEDCFLHGTDNYMVTLGTNTCKAIPIGNGEKIRGLRATEIIADEFASIQLDIFETVIVGFGAVSASPSKNVQEIAKQKLAKKYGIEIEVDNNVSKGENKLIISGTASLDWNHFSDYHKKWIKIIKTRGDKNKLREIFGEKLEDDINWKDYSVIRIPYELIPEGFMDASQVARSKATMTKANYLLEYSACFVVDTDGFYKNSLLRQCTVDQEKTFRLPSGRELSPEESMFIPELYGERHKQYIYGVDPASRRDNFSIVILEDCGEYRKVVYVWVTDEKSHKEKLKCGITKEHNFYAFVARKIRELMKTFPCKKIALDGQGGGIAVIETLRDRDKLLPGEKAILHVVTPGEPRDSDIEDGLHIIEECSFSSDVWTSEANHGMKKDFEDNVILFPYVDAISIALAEYEDEGKVDETLNELIFNIEELKKELTTIIVTETATGREHFDTPEIKIGNSTKKGRMKKDRYSALLMANAVARKESFTYVPLQFDAGGFANSSYKRREQVDDSILFTGPSWITGPLTDLYR